MPTYEVITNSTANDYCFNCDKTTKHHATNVHWEDGSREYLCYCTVCENVHQSVLDSDIPHHEHQKYVNECANKYLQLLLKGSLEESQKGFQAMFSKDWLLALQIIEETIVLQENQPTVWMLNTQAMQVLHDMQESLNSGIATLRGGRLRTPTTPTLSGGEKRGKW